jgi:hypothetical protein
MDIKDVYIPDQNYQGTEEELQHGRQWSEEAKERVRQARKAGRSVRDMFGSFYAKQGRSLNKSLNKVANRTIYKKSISNARNKLVVAKSNRDLSYKRGVALKNSSSGFVSKGSSPVEKGRRAGIVAKLKRDNDVDKMVKDATVSYRKKELKKSSNHSTGRIVKDATKVISKDVSKKANKLTNDVGKGINNTVRTIDRSITSAVNKGVANKDRKTTSKKEKKLIDAVKKRESLRLANIRKKENAKIDNTGRFDLLNSTRSKKKAEATKARDLKLAKENKVSQKRIKDTTEGTIRKNKYSSVGDIVSKETAKTAKSLKKGLKSTSKKLAKTVNDVNTNNGKGYRLTDKTTVRPQGEYERYASEVGGGNVYGKRKVAVIKEGTRANSITDALTGKTNAYKEYSTKTEYKTWKEPKKKSKSKSKSKNKLRQSALNDVYIPGKTGTSDEILHSDFF